jgi:hypothetical protein
MMVQKAKVNSGGKMASTEFSRVVVVAADVNIDWILARSERSTGPLAAWSAETSTCGCPQGKCR